MGIGPGMGDGSVPTQFKPDNPGGPGRGKGKVPRSSAAVQLCRENNIIEDMIKVAKNLVGMLAIRQQAAGNTDEGRLAFAKDTSNVKLAGAAIDALDKCAQYGYAKVARVHHVGDAPTVASTTEHRFVFEMRMDDARRPAAPAASNGSNNGHGTIIDGTAGPARPDDDD